MQALPKRGSTACIPRWVDHSQAGKCPDLIFAIDAYKAISLHIRQIFAEYTPIIEPLSLDEAYLDATENLAKHI
jgi:nucleotidyltransferase/DNA polymerase involved in DNA repair